MQSANTQSTGRNHHRYFFPCVVAVDIYFVGYVTWVALMSSGIYIQYFLRPSRLVTARKDINDARFSSNGFLSILLSMETPVQPDFQRYSLLADLFYRCKWKSKLCEKSNTNKWFPNCAGLERKYKLTSGHSTQGRPFSVFCLSHHMDCTDCTIVLLHAFPSPGSRFWQRAVRMCPCHEPTSFQIGEQEMMFVHRLCPPPSDYWGLQVDS